MVRALQDEGICVDVATTDDGFPSMLRKQFTEWREMRVRFFPRVSAPSFLREFGFSPSFVPWARRHFRDYDLIHVHALFSFVCTAAMSMARHQGMPYLNRPLGMLGRWPMQQRGWKKRIYLRLMEKTHLRDAAAIHFTSQEELTEASSILSHERSAIISHGIDLPMLIPDAKAVLHERLNLPPREKIILYLGRLHAKKGLDLLLDAFQRLKEQQTTLVIAGDGEPVFVEALDASIRKSNLATKIRRTGFVFGAEKNLLLQGADLFVLPSHHENFGYAVLEALAAGTPVLISERVALAREVQRHQLGIVTELDAASIAQAMRFMLGQDQPAQSSQIRSFVEENYSWKTCSRSIVRLYHAVSADRVAAQEGSWRAAPSKI